MKKFLIILTVCILVIAAALTTVLIVLNANGEVADDPGCRYSYTFIKKGTGILVTVTGGEQGYLWQSVSDTSVFTVADAEAKEGKTAFLVTPEEDGEDVLTLTLSGSSETIPDCLYVIRVVFSVEDGKLKVPGSNHIELQGLTRYEANADRPFVLSNGPDGCLYLLAKRQSVQMASEDDTDAAAETSAEPEDQSGIVYNLSEWTVLYDKNATAVAVTDSEAGTVFTVQAGILSGETSVSLVPPGKDGTALTLTLNIGEDGVVTMLNAAWETLDLEEKKEEEKQKEVVRTVGDIVLPAGAEYKAGNTMALPGENGITYIGAWISFTAGETSYNYMRMPNAPAAPLLTYWKADEASGTEVTVASVTGMLYETEYGMLVVWSQDETSCSLCAPNITGAQAVEMASDLCEAGGQP